MRSISFFKTFAAATLGLGIVGASLGQQKPEQPTTPASQPNSPYQGQKGTPAPQTNPATQTPQPIPQPGQTSGSLAPQPVASPKTALSQAMQQLNATKTVLNAPTLLTIGAVNVQPVDVGTTVTFTTEVFDRQGSKAGYMFAMTGAPWGSYIDQKTGIFTWIPNQPGIYNFYVWAMDLNDNTRQAFQQVNITVNALLQNFGYDFFRSSRALLDARLFLIRTGQFPLVGPAQLGQTQQLTTLQIPQPNSQQNPMQQLMQGSGLLGGSSQQLQSPGAFQPPITPFTSPNMQNLNQGGNPLSPFGQSQSPLGQQNGGSGPQGLNMPGGIQGALGSMAQAGGIGGVSQLTSQPGAAQALGQLGQGPNGLGGFGNYNGFGSQVQNGFGGGSAFGGQGGQGGYGGSGLNQGGQGSGVQNQFGGSGQGIGGQGPFGQSQLGYGQGPFGQGQQSFGGQGMQQFGGQQFNQAGQQMLFGNGMQAPFGQPGNPLSGLYQPLPSATPFPTLGSQYVGAPGSNGMPQSASGLTFDALRYVVSPWEQLGNNVYVPYPDRYQLGPGDMLTVTISSPYMDAQNIDVKLDTQGALTIPTGNMKLVLRGKTLGEAEKLINARVAKVLKGGRATLMLKELRTMSITIAGDAYVPGEYQMPAVATLFNTIYVCGGPADSGSMRKIELRHSDGAKQTFDLYDYFVLGKKTLDVPLQPGDVIWFAPAQTRVAVKGEVPRPDVYEALPSDSLKDLVSFAGGAKATGMAQRVYLQTEDPGVGHIVKDVDVKADGGSGRLFDGDVATILSTRPDYVLDDLTMNGAVETPGTYQFVKGETVADLVDKARGLRPDAYKLRADLLRLNPDQTQTLIPIDLPKALARNPEANVALQAHDALKVYSISDEQYVDPRQINIEGDVQKPQTYTRKDNERVADLVLEAGGTWPDAYLDVAYLKRTNKDGTEGQAVPIDLRRLFAGDTSQNVLLQDHDDLTIQSKAQAHFLPDQSVNILGAVQAPGNYQNNSNLRVSDLIQEAGGILPNANSIVEIAHARVSDGTPRVTLRLADVLNGALGSDPTLVDGDLVTVPGDSTIDLNGPRKVIVVGEVAHPGAFAVNRTERLADVIRRAGGVVSDGFLAGAQFYRDPTKLVSDTQTELSPRLQSVMAVVAADEYTRAIALSAVSKAQFLSSVSGGGGSVPIPGFGSATAPSSNVQVPSDVWEQQSVTPARTLTVNDLTPVGNINVRLAAALRNPKSSENLLLADGDIIVVPRIPSTVTIVGAVVVPSAVKYESDHTVGYYLLKTGGLTIDAAKDNIVVIRAGGLVQKANKSTKIGLGDQIYVPTKVMSVEFTNKLAQSEAITKDLISGAIVLALLKAFL